MSRSSGLYVFLVATLVACILVVYCWRSKTALHDFDVRDLGRPHEAYANVDSKFGYNVGDLLNFPSFVGAYKSDWPPNGKEELVDIAIGIHKSHPWSIIGRYFHDYTCCNERLPNVTRMRDVVASYGDNSTSESFRQYLRTHIENEQTLLVHVRSCDKYLPHKTFLTFAAKLSMRFQSIVLMGQCHHDTRYANQQVALENLKKSFEAIADSMDRGKVSLFPRANVDDHIFAMSRAKHLLVHRGGFSAVGALVCRGSVYYCDDMNAFTDNPEFLAHVARHFSSSST